MKTNKTKHNTLCVGHHYKKYMSKHDVGLLDRLKIKNDFNYEYSSTLIL